MTKDREAATTIAHEAENRLRKCTESMRRIVDQKVEEYSDLCMVIATDGLKAIMDKQAAAMEEKTKELEAAIDEKIEEFNAVVETERQALMQTVAITSSAHCQSATPAIFSSQTGLKRRRRDEDTGDDDGAAADDNDQVVFKCEGSEPVRPLGSSFRVTLIERSIAYPGEIEDEDIDMENESIEGTDYDAKIVIKSE